MTYSEGLRADILAALARSPVAMRVPEICDRVSDTEGNVTRALHALQDSDDVMMRSGWYWLSQRAKQEMDA